MQEIRLDRFQVATKAIISLYELENIDVSYYQDIIGNMVLKLQSEILAYTYNPNLRHSETFTNTVTRPRFANPWEHLKARWAGRSWFSWYVKRKPVKFIEETYTVKINVNFDLQELVSFPENRYVFPRSLGNPVVMIQEKNRKVSWSGPLDKLDPLV